MFRVSDIIDLPIVALRTGRRICTVKSVLIDASRNVIFAFICKESIGKKNIEIIPYKSMLQINYEQLTVYDKAVIKRIWVGNLDQNNFYTYENIVGRFLINSNKEINGTLTDIYFEAINGRIKCYEYSEGYFDDLIKGRKTISCTGDNDNLFNQIKPMEDRSVKIFEYKY